VSIVKETLFRIITGDKLMDDKEIWDIATEDKRIALCHGDTLQLVALVTNTNVANHAV